MRSTLGNIYHALGKFAKAEAMFREALAIQRRLHGQENLEVANSIEGVAKAMLEGGKLDQPEALLREALAIKRKLLGKEHQEIATSLGSLAAVFYNQGKLAESEALYREALSMRRKLLGNEDLEVAFTLSNFGFVLYGEGKLVEAEATLREALALQEKLSGDDTLDTALSLKNLADVLHAEGKLAEAETTHRAALAIRRKLLPKDHPYLAASLNDLALTLTAAQKLSEAEAINREALAMYQRVFGFEPDTYLADATLVGQDGWIAPPPFSPNAAVVTSDKPRQGKQTAHVLGADLVPQDFINDATGGYYDAIGSYGRAVNYDTGNAQKVRVSAHVRVDGPGTAAGNNFFSAAVSTRAATVVDGSPSTASVGELAISSDGHAYAYSGNDNVPTFLARVPVTLGAWHNLAIVADFGSMTSSFCVDDVFLVEAGDFFVELLGQTIDSHLVGGAVGPEIKLREALVGEAVADDEAWMAGLSRRCWRRRMARRMAQPKFTRRPSVSIQNHAAVRQQVFVPKMRGGLQIDFSRLSTCEASSPES